MMSIDNNFTRDQAWSLVKLLSYCNLISFSLLYHIRLFSSFIFSKRLAIFATSNSRLNKGYWLIDWLIWLIDWLIDWLVISQRFRIEGILVPRASVSFGHVVNETSSTRDEMLWRAFSFFQPWTGSRLPVIERTKIVSRASRERVHRLTFLRWRCSFMQFTRDVKLLFQTWGKWITISNGDIQRWVLLKQRYPQLKGKKQDDRKDSFSTSHILYEYLSPKNRILELYEWFDYLFYVLFV